MTGKDCPGEMHGDQSVYAGRALLGFIRPSVGGIRVYSVEGKALGSFLTRKAAMAALTTSIPREEGAHGV